MTNISKNLLWLVVVIVVIGGSLDLVTPAEFPVTLATLNSEKLSILTEVNETAGGFPMILRKEGDTFDAQTYFSKKRKIATSVGGGPEFFTVDFFKKYNIKPSQYEIVSMQPQDMPIALANGSVDGIAIYEPFAHFAIQQTGADKVFSIKSDDLYSEIIILVGKTDWISQNEKTAEKFLRALKKSESFIKSNPEEARNIAKHLAYFYIATWLGQQISTDYGKRSAVGERYWKGAKRNRHVKFPRIYF